MPKVSGTHAPSSIPLQGDHVLNDVGSIAKTTASKIRQQGQGLPEPRAKRMNELASGLEQSARRYDGHRASAGTTNAARPPRTPGDPGLGQFMHGTNTGDANSFAFGRTKSRIEGHVDQLLAGDPSGQASAHTGMNREIDRIRDTAYDADAHRRANDDKGSPKARKEHDTAVETGRASAVDLLKETRDAAGQAALLKQDRTPVEYRYPPDERA